MKKLISVLLTLALLATMCVSAFAEGTSETITITVAGRNYNTDDWNQTNQVKMIEERFGIKMECTSYESDAWSARLTLMLASDEMPDLILNPGISLSEISDYGSQGYFLDLTDLIDEYAPNIKAQFDNEPNYRAYCTANDGKIYTLTQLASNLCALVPRAWLNKTWMDNLGLAYPTTVEELRDVFIAFRDQDANGNGDATDEIPLSVISGNILQTLYAAYGFNTRTDYYILQQTDDEVYLAETTDAYKAFLTYMNDLWNENLLDHAHYTQTGDEAKTKAAEDRLGAYGAAAPYVYAGKDVDFDSNFYWLGGLTSPYNDKAMIVKSSNVSSTAKVLVNANTKYGKEIVQLLDFFYTQEGTLASSYGIEGQDLDMTAIPVDGLDEYGVVAMYQPDGYTSGEAYRYKKAIINEGFNLLKPLIGTQYAAILNASEDQLKELLPLYGWAVQFAANGLKNPNAPVVEAFPTLLYTQEEAEERTGLYTDISLYIKTMQAQFVTGEADIEKDWDTFQSTLEQMGLSRLMEIEQTAYDRLTK